MEQVSTPQSPIREHKTPSSGHDGNIIVDELWRVFTFYSLHTDPLNPGRYLMKKYFCYATYN